jgi:hypothetical protein
MRHHMENFNSYKNVADLLTANSKYKGESMNKTNLHFSQTYVSIMYSWTQNCITACLNV